MTSARDQLPFLRALIDRVIVNAMTDPRAWIPCAQFYAFSGQFDKVGIIRLFKPHWGNSSSMQERECYRGAYQNAKSRAGWEKDDILCMDLVEAASNLTRGTCAASIQFPDHCT